MKARTSIALVSVALAASWVYAVSAQQGDGPKYAAGTNNLLRPTDYREWMFLSSSIGLTYQPPMNAQAPGFGNVFVNPTSYRSFLQTGKWPDRTIFVLEFRQSAAQGSVSKDARYQTGFGGYEAEVKDSRFPDGWAFYAFRAAQPGENGVPPLAGDNAAPCVDCHTKHTAVERTFVQYYPTLLDVAKKMGTVNAGYTEP
jgi:hypothetical protein